jgi:DNA-binding MarR family transcriptional regulator
MKEDLLLPILRIERVICRAYDKILKPYGLTARQFYTLSAFKDFKDNQPIMFGDLVNYLCVDRTTISRTVRPLIANNLVSVKLGLLSIGKNRKKKNLVYITKKGRDVFNECRDLIDGLTSPLLRRFDCLCFNSDAEHLIDVFKGSGL